MKITIIETGSILLPGTPNHMVKSYEFCCREMSKAISNDGRNGAKTEIYVVHPVRSAEFGLFIQGANDERLNHCPWCGARIEVTKGK